MNNKIILIFNLAICLLLDPVKSWSGYQSPLVPAYFEPGPLWDEMIEIGAGIIIANPNSGPGVNFTNILPALFCTYSLGLTVFGPRKSAEKLLVKCK
jgi:hypothetical protein